MSPVPISPDIVGMDLDPITRSWKRKDVMLYALGVGAGPDDELEYVYEGRGPVVLPTYGVIPGLAAMMSLLTQVEIDVLMMLHGEQRITLHRDLPPEATVEVSGRITEVWDKGSAAVIGFEGTGADADGPMFTAAATLFIRGAGGFGGEKGPSTKGRNVPPDREPDHVVTLPTRRDQAALYRLSGDYNPLHIDPDVAGAAGFDEPFLHGLCTFGIVGRAILRGALGGDASAFGSLEGRFADQVWLGQSIVTKLWDTDDGIVVQAENPDGDVVLSQARATRR